MKTIAITHERLLQVLRYDRKTGQFFWRVGRKMKGKRAGTSYGPNGARGIGIDYRRYYEHTLAFFYVHGRWPARVDHKNRKPWLNYISNLREASASQNSANRDCRHLNKNGYTGVHRGSGRQRYYAQLTCQGVVHSLCGFKSAKQAYRARMALKRKLFGEFCEAPA